MPCFSPRPGSQFQGMARAGALHVISYPFEELAETLAEAMAHGRPGWFDCDTGPRGMNGLPIRWGMWLA